MPTKNTVRADLKHLRKLCKSISLIENAHPAVEGIYDPLLEEQRAALARKRDKILRKYRDAIEALAPVESLIFTLYYLEGKTQKQVATKTNYCKSSITKYVSIMLDKLK